MFMNTFLYCLLFVLPNKHELNRFLNIGYFINIILYSCITAVDVIVLVAFCISNIFIKYPHICFVSYTNLHSLFLDVFSVFVPGLSRLFPLGNNRNVILKRSSIMLLSFSSSSSSKITLMCSLMFTLTYVEFISATLCFTVIS